MEGEYRTTSAIALSNGILERLTQEGSGPFSRTHSVDQHSLVYIPSVHSNPSLGCFGNPRSHRSFRPFGATILVPAHVPLHVLSPGFSEREMIIARFHRADFDALTGMGERWEEAELNACADVRAPSVLDAMERLLIEMARPATARETMIAGLGLIVLSELARHFERVRGNAHARRGVLAAWQVRRIEERLGDRSLPMPDVDELANLCGIGRRHLMRAYKATTGSTVMDRVERTAFDRATCMLAEEVVSVKSIALALGYECQGSFSTAFRRRFGETPSTYRARRASERRLQ